MVKIKNMKKYKCNKTLMFAGKSKAFTEGNEYEIDANVRRNLEKIVRIIRKRHSGPRISTMVLSKKHRNVPIELFEHLIVRELHREVVFLLFHDWDEDLVDFY